MKAKLISFTVNKKDMKKVDFTFSVEEKGNFVLTLREMQDWPMIWGQPIELVEKWFLKNYQALFDFPLNVICA